MLVDENNKHAIAYHLRDLDPAIPERTTVDYPPIEQPQEPGVQYAMEIYRAWSDKQSMETLHKAHDVFKRLCQAGERRIDKTDSDELARAERLQIFGRACRFLLKTEDSIIALEKAIAIYERHQYIGVYHTHGLLSSRTELCDALVEDIKRLKKIGPADLLAVQRQKLLEQTKKVTEIYYLGDGRTPIDPSAHRIEQGEMGFFNRNTHTVGTRDVEDCLWLDTLHQPKSAAAHYDIRSDIESLQPIFEPASKDNALPMSIVGVMYHADFDITKTPKTLDEDLAKRSGINLNKLAERLVGKNVNIVSASIGDESQPTNVVSGPNHEIKEAIPGRENPDMTLSILNLLISSPNKPVHIAFDLTVSDKRAPYLFSAEEVERLHSQFIGKQIEELYIWAKKQKTFPDNKIPMIVGSILAGIQLYQTAVEHVLQQLKVAVEKSHDKVVQDAIQAIINGPIHVGSEAPICNQQLFDFVGTRFLKLNTVPDSTEQYVTADFTGLKSITDSFNPQPINAIYAYQKAFDHVVKKLEETVAGFGKLEIDPAHIKEATEIISHQISIEEDPAQSNKSLINFIQKQLFITYQDRDTNETKYRFNRIGLRNLPHQKPITASHASSQHRHPLVAVEVDRLEKNQAALSGHIKKGIEKINAFLTSSDQIAPEIKQEMSSEIESLRRIEKELKELPNNAFASRPWDPVKESVDKNREKRNRWHNKLCDDIQSEVNDIQVRFKKLAAKHTQSAWPYEARVSHHQYKQQEALLDAADGESVRSVTPVYDSSDERSNRTRSSSTASSTTDFLSEAHQSVRQHEEQYALFDESDWEIERKASPKPTSTLSAQQKEFLHLICLLTDKESFNNETTASLLKCMDHNDHVSHEAIVKALDQLKQANPATRETVAIGEAKSYPYTPAKTLVRALRNKSEEKRGETYYFLVSNLKAPPYCAIIKRDPGKNLMLISSGKSKKFYDEYLGKLSESDQAKVLSEIRIARLDGVALSTKKLLAVENTNKSKGARKT